MRFLRKRWVLELALVAAVLSAVLWWQRRGLVDPGATAPPLRLTAIDGATVDLADLRGKRVLVHFWATWCSVCVVQHGTINGVHDDAGDDAVVLSVVADGEDPAKVRAHLAKHDVRYRVLLGDRATLRAWKVKSFPTNYFVGADGRLHARDVGLATPWMTRWRLGG